MVSVVNADHLQEWLEEQPFNLVTVFAARNALRAFPNHSELFKIPEFRQQGAIILPNLRAIQLSMATTKWPNHVEKFVIEAKDAAVANAIYEIDADAYINSGAADTAVYAAISYIADHSTLIHVVNTAASADFMGEGDEFTNHGTIAAQQDVNFMLEHITHEALQELPLWPNNIIPTQILKNWKELKTSLLSQDPNWSVWTEWYDAILDGNAPMIEEIEIGDPQNGVYGRSTFPKEMYEEPPKLNAALKKVIDDYWAKQATLETPLPGAFDFSIKSGKLEASPSRNEVEQADNAQDALETLKDIIENCLNGLEANYADDLLKNAVKSFLEKLPEKAGQTQTGILAMRLAAINGFIGAYNQPDNESEKAILGALLSVKSASETFSAYFTDIQKIKSVQLALNLQEQDTDAINVEIDNIIKIAEPSEVIGASSITALSTGLEELSELNAKIGLTPSLAQQAELNAAKSKVTAHRVVTTQNFLARTAKEMKDLPKDVYKSARKGLMSGIEESTKGSVKVGLILLAFQLAGPVGALAATVATFRPFAKRAEDIKDEIEHIEI